MILKDEEALTRLNSPENLINSLKNNVLVSKITPGRPDGTISIPPMVKKLIAGVAHNSEESQTQIAKEFYTTQHTVSCLERGMDTGNRAQEPELIGLSETAKAKRSKKLEDAHGFALEALASSLETLVARMPEIQKPEKLSRIASDMSKVITNLKDKGDDEGKNRTVVVLFSPSLKTEAQFQSIEV